MQNTEIAFLYRDASNYKRLTTHVVKGEITETQKKKLLDSLECYDERTGFGYCIPEQLGIEIDRFDEYEQDEDDHCWAEVYSDDIKPSDEEPTLYMDINELVEKFVSIGSTGWGDVKYVVIA